MPSLRCSAGTKTLMNHPQGPRTCLHYFSPLSFQPEPSSEKALISLGLLGRGMSIPRGGSGSWTHKRLLAYSASEKGPASGIFWYMSLTRL